MIGVDVIGQIRRAYFEQGCPIKEIVRTLSVSRATVRKVNSAGPGGNAVYFTLCLRLGVSLRVNQPEQLRS